MVLEINKQKALVSEMLDLAKQDLENKKKACVVAEERIRLYESAMRKIEELEKRQEGF